MVAVDDTVAEEDAKRRSDEQEPEMVQQSEE